MTFNLKYSPTKKSGGHKLKVPDIETQQQRDVLLAYNLEKQEMADLVSSYKLVALEKRTVRFNLQKELLIAFTSKEKKEKVFCRL